jgi:hypothetical protein
MSANRRLPKTPADAFPDRDWRNWRLYVGQVDEGVLALASLAEAVDALITDRARDVPGRDKQSLRDIARQARVSPSLLSTVRRCGTYPRWDLIARLEIVLGRQLWQMAEVVLLERTTPERSRPTAPAA